jgi:kumamolisin
VTGKGQSIAIIALGGGYYLSDIHYYLKNVLNLTIPEISEINLRDASNDPGKNFFYDFEITMNLQVIAAISHGAKINVYFAQNTEIGFMQALLNAIFDKEKLNTVISISWGRAESSWRRSTMNTINSIFKAAAILGITICAPAGNNGACDGINDGGLHVEFPVSSPYVLGCGGTQIYLQDDKIANEVVWNEKIMNLHLATGGGFSKIFDMPFYQKQFLNLPESTNQIKFMGRGLPDVSCSVGSPGFNLYMDAKPTLLGGGATSAAAPFWAALIALLNEKVGGNAGYINPLIYMNGNNARAFKNITEGNNIVSKAGGYHACPGWNPCTGWGSPDGRGLLNLLGCV